MEDILYSKVLIIPKATTAVRDTMKAEVGTIIFNTTTNRINICKNASTGSGNWLVSASV